MAGGVRRVNLADCIGTIVAELAGITQNDRIGVVGKGTLKVYGRRWGICQVAENAVRVCRYVDGIGLGILSYGHNAVVAYGATTGNTRMIETTIQRQLQKSGGIVAIIAFDRRGHMRIGLTDG